MITEQKFSQKILKKEALSFLVMALLAEKKSPPLIKVKKNTPFKLCVVAGNRSRMVVTDQIYLKKIKMRKRM